MAPRVAYLGPRGTFTEDALREATGDAGDRARSRLPPSTRRSSPCRSGEADRALVPFENSIEGAVSATLDTLAFDADGVTLVGEYDLPIRHCLIAREEIPLDRDRGRPLPPPGERPVRPLHPREAAGRRGARGRQHRRGGAAGERGERALGRARGRLGRGALRLRRPARRGRGRAGQRHALRLGRAGGDEPPRAMDRGGPPSSSRSSARTTPGRWSRRSRSSPTAR